MFIGLPGPAAFLKDLEPKATLGHDDNAPQRSKRRWPCQVLSFRPDLFNQPRELVMVIHAALHPGDLMPRSYGKKTAREMYPSRMRRLGVLDIGAPHMHNILVIVEMILVVPNGSDWCVVQTKGHGFFGSAKHRTLRHPYLKRYNTLLVTLNRQ